MYIIRELIADGIESILLLVTFEALYNNKKFIKENKLRAICFCTLYIIVNYFSTFYISKVYHTLFLSIFCILLLSYITRIRIFISCVIFFLFLSIIFVTENFIQTIGILAYNINLNTFLSVRKYYLTFLIASKLLQILIVIIIFKFNKIFIKLKLFNSKYKMLSESIIQFGVLGLIVFIISFGIFNFNVKGIKIYNCTIFILYFIFLILQLNEIKRYKKMLNIESRYKIQENQIKNMKEIISIIRQEKHDFANHINVIWGLCSLNRSNTVEKIKNYVDGISDNLHSSFKYINTGNDYLDGLLSIKNNLANKNNIDLDIMIDEPFSKLKIKENELISIISNLLDNAFEAFQFKPNIKNKKITFDTFVEDNKFYIEISDNAGMIPKNIQDKIFEKGFSTKTKKSDDHGFGLYITKQLIKQNNGFIFLESNSEATKFLVAFNLEGTDE